MSVRRHPVALTNLSSPLANAPLDRSLIVRLRSTYEQVRESGPRLAEIFYAKLFARAPHLRPLFNSEPKAQCEKLMASLDAIVHNFESPIENAAMLSALGRRHVEYGAKPEHYELVIELLTESMRDLLGNRVDEQRLDEWRLALRLVSNQMLSAAESDPRMRDDA